MPALIVLGAVVVVIGAFVLLSGGDDDGGSDGDGGGALAASEGASGPEAAANAYVEALNARDCEAYVALWSQEHLGDDTVEQAVEDCEADGGPSPIEGTLADVEVVSEGGDTASVGIYFARDDVSGGTTYRELGFVREEDGWKWTGTVWSGPPPPDEPEDGPEDGPGGSGDLDAEEQLEQACRNMPPGAGGISDPEAQYEACINGEL